MATTITERLSGSPTLTDGPTDLAAIEDFTGSGIPERTGDNAWSLRPVTGANDAWAPQIADGLALGTAALPWSDLFFASGATVDWGNGDVTLSHAANTLSFAGATSGYVFDGTITPAANDGGALGAGASAFSDLFLASGAAIDFADGDVTVTHSANALAFAGASSGYSFDAALKVGGSTVALLATEDQTLAGGARVTTKDLGNLSGQTITPDPGDRPIQKITNNGAGTIAPGANQGGYLLVVKNASGAGAITLSGWSNVSGDSFSTSTSAEYLCHCVVVGDFSSMIIKEVTP